MSTILRSKPLARTINAAVPTTGIAVDLRPTSHGGRTPRQVQVTSDVLAFVGSGASASPPPPTTPNTGYHEAGATMVYTLGGGREAADDYWYVYAAAGTADVRVTVFGS